METAFSLDQTADGKFLSLDDLGNLLFHLASQGLLCLHTLQGKYRFEVSHGTTVLSFVHISKSIQIQTTL